MELLTCTTLDAPAAVAAALAAHAAVQTEPGQAGAEALVVGAPGARGLDVALRALQHGTHVLLLARTTETLSPEDAGRLRDAAVEHDCIVKAATPLRHRRSVRRALDDALAGDLGEIVSAQISFGSRSYATDRTLEDRDRTRAVFAATLDVAIGLLGAPSEILGTVRNRSSVATTLRAGDRVAQVTADSGCHSERFRLRITGSDSTTEASFDLVGEAPEVTTVARTPRRESTPEVTTILAAPPDGSDHVDLDEFVEAVERRREAANGHSQELIAVAQALEQVLGPP